MCSSYYFKSLFFLQFLSDSHVTRVSRRLTLAAYSAAGNVQTVHHRPQMPTRSAPPYLSELCIPVSTSAGRHFLRSATYGDLLVPRMSTSTYGPRSFAVSGPSVWNKLPATLRVSPTLGQFQSKLKAVLFRSAYET